MNYLIVVDMQNDFIDGSLGSAMAQAIVPKVVEKAAHFDGKVIFTRAGHRSLHASRGCRSIRRLLHRPHQN